MFDLSAKTGRFRRFFWTLLATLGLSALLLGATGYSKSDSPREVGSDAYQFVGRIDQNGPVFVGYGYLSAIEGLAPGDLFADPFNGSAETAHFTYYATATLTSRSVATDTARSIFSLDSAGEITFYYQSYPSASFDDPQSFQGGTPIATAATNLQDVLSVQDPNHGLAVTNGTFAIQTAAPFTFGAETLRFGHPGVVHQISTFGDALRTEPSSPQSTVLLAGNATRSSFQQIFLPSISR